MKRALLVLAATGAALLPATAHASQPSPVGVVLRTDNGVGAGVIILGQPGAGVWYDATSGEVCFGISYEVPFCAPVNIQH